MNASLLVAAGMVCALGAQGNAGVAVSRITEVTVYQGQALVTREVTVPEGEGTVEVTVGPLPERVVGSSLFAEGTDGVRVSSTRVKNELIPLDAGEAMKQKEAEVEALRADVKRMENEILVDGEDLNYMRKLEAFTATALSNLTAQGRVDSSAVLAISDYVIKTRGIKSKGQVELREQFERKQAAIRVLDDEIGRLKGAPGRLEHSAIVVVRKATKEAGTIRLGYLVAGANWVPQYRLRGHGAGGEVKLDYLAAVTQESGEAWRGVKVTLSNARPSQDAAPPELLPLKMEVAGETAAKGLADAAEDRTKRINGELARLVDVPFEKETSLDAMIAFVKEKTRGAGYSDGIPIYVDPNGLQSSEKTMASTVTMSVSQVPLSAALRLMLEQLSLGYRVKDGLLTIMSTDQFEEESLLARGGWYRLVDGQADIVSHGDGGGETEGVGGARLNAAAARDQSEELRVSEAGNAASSGEKDGPGVTFRVAGTLDLLSRPESQLLEVARVDLPAESFVKAVPVLTPRVYRLARVTNRSDVVLLPGDATIYVDGSFVGKMKLPLVASGEPFVVGLGVDPQIQVSRRLVSKTRSVKGGNQVLAYEFRLGLRNYRGDAVKVQLWDRLPKAPGESVGVNLVKTSVPLSTDGAYERISRLDNLLRWDLELPKGTIGEKTLYLNYAFQLEYSREMPQPKFESGGLREAPIGGGAMGMGGMGGGMGGMR